MKDTESHHTTDEAIEKPAEMDAGDPSSAAAETTETDNDTAHPLEEALAEERNRALRIAADLENFRKRMQREKEELRRFATSSLIEDLLPTMDNLQLGLKTADQHPEAKSVADGFRIVSEQLQKTLEKHGLKAILPQGEEFDPNFHECVAHQPNEDVAEDHVISVLRTGYSLNDRLLRPATVIVSSGKAESGE